MATANEMAIQRLAGVLQNIEAGVLVVYGEEKHEVKAIDLGSGVSLEIHYYSDGSEINEAFFVADGARIALSREEIETVALRF